MSDVRCATCGHLPFPIEHEGSGRCLTTGCECKGYVQKANHPDLMLDEDTDKFDLSDT